jgi:hypothetical protein
VALPRKNKASYESLAPKHSKQGYHSNIPLFSSETNISSRHEYCGEKILQLHRYVNRKYKLLKILPIKILKGTHLIMYTAAVGNGRFFFPKYPVIAQKFQNFNFS